MNSIDDNDDDLSVATARITNTSNDGRKRNQHTRCRDTATRKNNHQYDGSAGEENSLISRLRALVPDDQKRLAMFDQLIDLGKRMVIRKAVFVDEIRRFFRENTKITLSEEIDEVVQRLAQILEQAEQEEHEEQHTSMLANVTHGGTDLTVANATAASIPAVNVETARLALQEDGDSLFNVSSTGVAETTASAGPSSQPATHPRNCAPASILASSPARSNVSSLSGNAGNVAESREPDTNSSIGSSENGNRSSAPTATTPSNIGTSTLAEIHQDGLLGMGLLDREGQDEEERSTLTAP